MHHYLRNERGFALLELMISMLVIAMVFIVVSSIFKSFPVEEEPTVAVEETIFPSPEALDLKAHFEKAVIFSLTIAFIMMGLIIIATFIYKDATKADETEGIKSEDATAPTLSARIENSSLELEMKEKFRLVLEQMNKVRTYEPKLDAETKHLMEYTLTNDLRRLLSLYEELDGEQKAFLDEDILPRLDLVQEKVQHILAQLAEKKETEIQKTLHLFDQRYEI